MSAGMQLYDLAGADERVRFSPYCWRTRLALAHKALSAETVAWRFTEKEAIAFSGQGKVPVLVDGEHCIHDSWQIAEYLEATYPDRPSLFGSAAEHALVRFVERWTTETLHSAIGRVIAPDLLAMLHEKDRAYFQTTREAAFGTTFAAMILARDEALATLRRVLQPLRSTLAAQPFLAGTAPNYADHVVFGAFQWARVSSPVTLLAADDTSLQAWCERMLDAYDGIARAAQRAV